MPNRAHTHTHRGMWRSLKVTKPSEISSLDRPLHASFGSWPYPRLAARTRRIHDSMAELARSTSCFAQMRHHTMAPRVWRRHGFIQQRAMSTHRCEQHKKYTPQGKCKHTDDKRNKRIHRNFCFLISPTVALLLRCKVRPKKRPL